MSSEKKRDAGFEKDLEKLESIVNALEEGGMSLDEALKQFETGIHLTRNCEKALRQAEKKIEMLMRNTDGELQPQPFDENMEDAAPMTAPLPPAAPAAATPSLQKTSRESIPEPPCDDDIPDSAYDDGEDLDELF